MEEAGTPLGCDAGSAGGSGDRLQVSYPAMQNAPRPARRTRSAFAAAFLSFVFPGLGQAYAGAVARGLAFAALPFLLIALTAGIVLRASRLSIAGFLLQQPVLIGLFIVNVLLLVYRLAAVFDAWQVARYLNAYDGADRPSRRTSLPLSQLSVAGLLATVLVLAGGHVVVARYNVLALDFVGCVFSDNGDSNCTLPSSGGTGTASASPSGSGGPDGSVSPSDAAPTPIGSAGAGTPAPSLPPWNGTDKLNILLVGVDQRPGDGTFNTDTTIVVSVDPVSKQVAMFQLPRDTVNVPVPANARGVWGSVYSGKITTWWTQNRNRGDLWPGSTPAARGFNALKAILGELYGIKIPYYVEVNFDGFRQAVDTLGGVVVNVQMPVPDNDYPGPSNTIRVYYPSGPQVMSGEEALIYARSRHASSDFDRGRRQQRVLLSLHDQLNPQAILANLPSLLDTLQRSVKTDIPTSMVESLLSLSSTVDTKNVHSFVFGSQFVPGHGYNYYSTDMWGPSHGTNSNVVLNDPNRVRQAVANAFTVAPAIQAQQQALADELAQVYVLDGSGRTGLATGTAIASYLSVAGLDASAPNQSVATTATTKIVVYNGAETKLPQTIAYLESLFGVKVTTATDPTVIVDVVVTVGKNAPTLTVEAPG